MPVPIDMRNWFYPRNTTSYASAGRSARQQQFRFNRATHPSGRGTAFGSLGPIRATRRASLRGGLGVTVQHDKQSVYRKKRMPLKMKKRWRRFKQRVHAVAEKDLGTRTCLFSTEINQLVTNNTQDAVMSLSLYGQKSTITHLTDLNRISNLENVGNPTAVAGATVDRMAKFLFQSAVLDVTFRNASLVRIGSAIGPASEATIELDIYQIYARKDFDTSGVTYQSLGDAIKNEGNQEKIIGNAGGFQNILIEKRGVTPFEVPTALSRLGLKIVKKTKYFVPSGGSVTYQMRDPKRRVSLGRELNDEEGANRPGWTKWLLLNYKLVPGLPLGVEDGQYRLQAFVGATRKYCYKVEGVPENRNAYLRDGVSIANPI